MEVLVMHTDNHQGTKKFVSHENFLADIIAHSAMQELQRSFPYGDVVDSYVEKVNGFWKIIIFYKDSHKS